MICSLQASPDVQHLAQEFFVSQVEETHEMHEDAEAAEHQNKHLDPPQPGDVPWISELHHKVPAEPE